MSTTSQGSLEVEQTLRLARDAIELDIARYRTWVFAVVVAATSLIPPVGLSDRWTPPLFMSGVLAYAVLVRVFLLRRGNPPFLAIVSLCVDLAAGGAVFVATRRLGAGAGDDPRF